MYFNDLGTRIEKFGNSVPEKFCPCGSTQRTFFISSRGYSLFGYYNNLWQNPKGATPSTREVSKGCQCIVVWAKNHSQFDSARTTKFAWRRGRKLMSSSPNAMICHNFVKNGRACVCVFFSDCFSPGGIPSGQSYSSCTPPFISAISIRKHTFVY